MSFARKAKRLLEWSKKSQAELLDHAKRGEIEDVERVLFTLLTLLSSIHEALGAVATVAGEQAWLLALNKARENDRLLWYLWKARDADVHDAVVKWAPEFSQLSVRVVDPAKTHAVSRQFRPYATPAEDMQRLFQFVYGVSSEQEFIARFAKDIHPVPERLAEAGVEIDFALRSLTFRQFATKVHGRTVAIREPDRHMGRELPTGAHIGTQAAIEYYSSKLGELQGFLGQSTGAEQGGVA